jgi:hypothetical protein
MSARERERGELPSPQFVLARSQDWAGTFCFGGSISEIRLFTLALAAVINCGVIERRLLVGDQDADVADCKLSGQKVLALTESNKPESARSID